MHACKCNANHRSTTNQHLLHCYVLIIYYVFIIFSADIIHILAAIRLSVYELMEIKLDYSPAMIAKQHGRHIPFHSTLDYIMEIVTC